MYKIEGNDASYWYTNIKPVTRYSSWVCIVKISYGNFLHTGGEERVKERNWYDYGLCRLPYPSWFFL